MNVFDRSAWRCPKCDGEDYRIVSGLEFRIDSIEVAEGAGDTERTAVR